MTQAELESLCKEWQERLRLQDWKVDVRLCRHYEMDEPDNWGQCRWNIEHKFASIKVVDPGDVSPNRTRPYDPETVLVHELLHLHMIPFTAGLVEKDTLEHRMMEQMLNVLDDMLVRLKRGAIRED